MGMNDPKENRNTSDRTHHRAFCEPNWAEKLSGQTGLTHGAGAGLVRLGLGLCKATNLTKNRGSN